MVRQYLITTGNDFINPDVIRKRFNHPMDVEFAVELFSIDGVPIKDGQDGNLLFPGKPDRGGTPDGLYGGD